MFGGESFCNPDIGIHEVIRHDPNAVAHRLEACVAAEPNLHFGHIL